MTDLISVRTAMGILGLSHNRILQLIRSGRLPAQRPGGSYVLDRTAVEHFATLDRPAGRPAAAKDHPL